MVKSGRLFSSRLNHLKVVKVTVGAPAIHHVVHGVLHLARIVVVLRRLQPVLQFHGADHARLQGVHGYLVLGWALHPLVLLIEDDFVICSDDLFQLLLVVALGNLSAHFELLMKLEQLQLLGLGENSWTWFVAWFFVLVLL